jgi:hypothetical protein
MSTRGLTDDQIYSLAESIYFNVIAELNLTEQCIENDFENEGCTRNTERGQDLYWTIEQTLQDFN